MGFLGSLAMVASGAVIVPYATAFLCNLFHLWPFTLQNFIKAMKPHQVYLLNCLIVREFIKLKYLPIYIRWNYFYRFADKKHVIKDIAFGRNERHLDLYIPTHTTDTTRPKPVVIYIFGGAYSSGDKSMYGMLCSNLSHRLDAIVCCPNYSIYPRGYMDDMVQDVVDCISWVHANISHYGGNKDQLLLVGFSCGAHICAMSLLELYHTGPSDSATNQRYSMQFIHQHFNGDTDKSDAKDSNNSSHASSSSFDIINGAEASHITDVSPADILGDTLNTNTNKSCEIAEQTDTNTSEIVADINIPNRDMKDMFGVESIAMSPVDTRAHGDGLDDVLNVKIDDNDDDESVVTIKANDDDNDSEPTSLLQLGMSIKGFVAISGVYDISAHYEYEKKRGVEKVSALARAAYGQQHFDRMSVTFLLHSFNTTARFPVVTILHGRDDLIVPCQSSLSFSRQLKQHFNDVTLHIIDACNHHQACIHMMDVSFKHYERIMAHVHETFDRAFNT